MLTRLSWRTITVNFLTHRHAITCTWRVMYPCTFKFNVWYLNTCNHPIEIYISAFHLRHLCIPTRLVKAIHNLNTSLIKQCYTWYAWTGANNAADTDMLLILLCFWYWYVADTILLLILIYWYCWGMYALYYMLYALCLTSIYFTIVSCYKIMLLLNQVPSKLNKSNISSNTLKSFKT
jgi:hypothetical protein